MITVRTRPWLALAAALTLAGGVVACTESEQENAESDTAATGEALEEEAAQIGAAIEAGAREVGQEIDEATDNLAQEAEEQRAETRTDRDADGATETTR